MIQLRLKRERRQPLSSPATSSPSGRRQAVRTRRHTGTAMKRSAADDHSTEGMTRKETPDEQGRPQ